MSIDDKTVREVKRASLMSWLLTDEYWKETLEIILPELLEDVLKLYWERTAGWDYEAHTQFGTYTISTDGWQVGGRSYLWIAGAEDGNDYHSEHPNILAAQTLAKADYIHRVTTDLKIKTGSTPLTQLVTEALQSSLNFVEGFCDDEMQEGIPALIQKLKSTLLLINPEARR